MDLPPRLRARIIQNTQTRIAKVSARWPDDYGLASCRIRIRGAISGSSEAEADCLLRHLTDVGHDALNGVPVYLDSTKAESPQIAGKLSFVEKQGTPAKHLGPLLSKVSSVKPVSIGFFGGKLDLQHSHPFAWLFVKLIIRGKAGDYRNWDAINEWALSLTPMLDA